MTSVPLDTAEGAKYLTARLALLAKVFLALGGFFFFAGATHRAVFLGQHLGIGNVVHLGVMLFQATLLALLTRGQPRALSSVDGALTIGSLSGAALQMRVVSFPLRYPIDIVFILLTFFVLSARAAIVPSTPLRTGVVGVLGTIPAFAMVIWWNHRNGRVLEGLSFATLWCIAGVGLTTLTSRVIYGLRRTAMLAKRLGQYVLEDKLGEGGMGAVYRASHATLRRPTAIKLLPAERAGADTVARFEREVQATCQLSHPNTVAIYDYGRTADGIFYYAMEYLEGSDLERLVAKHGPQPAARVVHVLTQIAGALTEAHGRGLIHRDMKPANVMLCERGGIPDTVKVVDFGLVKAARDPLLTDANAVIGTPAYLSPEAIKSGAVLDARADLYAVGAIGYWLLTGRRVFDGASPMDMCLAHLHDIPVAPSVYAAVPIDLERVILRCLAKNPADRPTTAKELIVELQNCDVPAWTPEKETSHAIEVSGCFHCGDDDTVSLAAGLGARR